MHASVTVPHGCLSAGARLTLTLECDAKACRGTVETDLGKKAELAGPRSHVVARCPGAKRSSLLAGLEIAARPSQEVAVDVSLLEARTLRIRLQAGLKNAAFVVAAPDEVQHLSLSTGGARLRFGVSARWLDVDRARVTLVRPKGPVIQRIVQVGEPLPLDCHNSPLDCSQALTLTVTAAKS
jgi:hypothetical protein